MEHLQNLSKSQIIRVYQKLNLQVKTTKTKKTLIRDLLAPLSYKMEGLEKAMYPFWVGKVAFPDVPASELWSTNTWRPHLDLLNTMYTLGPYNTIPAGTLLFHASSLRDPLQTRLRPGKPFFFGLDAFVSIWYAAETYQDQAFLNVYMTTVDFKNVNYLGDEVIEVNPGEVEDCLQDICLHPQFGYHADELVLEPPCELSLELTIPSDKLKDAGLILVKIYDIDLEMLKRHKYTTYPEFKAVSAIRPLNQ